MTFDAPPIGQEREGKESDGRDRGEWRAEREGKVRGRKGSSVSSPRPL